MGCINSKVIENPHYKPNAGNGFVKQTPRDRRLGGVEIPCGYCEWCVRRRRNEWKQRITEEAIKSPFGYGYFITLSLSEESMDELIEAAGSDEVNECAKVAVRRFTERWRKKWGKAPRHWMVAEIGSKRTERLHFHGLLWCSKEQLDSLAEIWGKGNVWAEKARGERTANYIVKYITKPDKKHPGLKMRMYVSQKIGAGYLESKRAKRARFQGRHTEAWYYGIDGKRAGMASYYRRRIYSDAEREDLRLYGMEEPDCIIGGRKIKNWRTSGLAEWQEVVKRLRIESLEAGYKPFARRRYGVRNGGLYKRKLSDKEIPSDKKIKILMEEFAINEIRSVNLWDRQYCLNMLKI